MRKWNVALCTLFALFLLPVGLLAQDTPQLLRVPVEASSDGLPPINLRPNTTTVVGIYLQNPTRDDFRNVTVKLVQLGVGQPKVIAQTEMAKLLPREEVRLVFPPPPPAAPRQGWSKGRSADNGWPSPGLLFTCSSGSSRS